MKAIKKIVLDLLFKINLKKYIVFESRPDFSDNTYPVFKELYNRGYNKKYKFVWLLADEKYNNLHTEFKNTIFIGRENYAFLEKIKRIFCLSNAALTVSCNDILPKYNNRVYAVNLTHGSSIKYVGSSYRYPKNFNVIDSLSDYYIKTDSAIFELNADNFVPLGFPRNDALFCRFDLSNIFGNFDKFIYWMPTYRQHFSGNAIHSDISFPIIYSADIAKQINECARNNNVFIIIKPHPAQDLTLITAYDYSNLKFINDDFLINMDVSNYKILGNCDALITDYSSVFLDYMLVDKPMCLTWDDFEQYEKMEGFAIDIDYVMSAGEKVYNYRQLCGFIERIAKGKDLLKTQRNKILKSTHKYFDANSTNRIVNYIIENANLKKL